MTLKKHSTTLISLESYRALRSAQNEDPSYSLRIRKMDKVELLDEMVRFQEERSELGELTLSLILRGRVLFRALEENAETEELRALTRSYRRHLELELEDFKKKGAV